MTKGGMTLKIIYENPTSMRLKANVWHNDQLHELAAGESLELPVNRGDRVSFKVGRFSAKHTLSFQSPQATFAIQPNKTLQTIYFAVVFVLVMALFFVKNPNTVVVTVGVVIGLIGYEALMYFVGYRARPRH